MQTRTSIGGKDFIVNGSSDAVNTFIRVKVALEADGCNIVLPENNDSEGREPYQDLEVYGVGKVFLTGSINRRTLIVELPIEAPVYA